MGVPYFCIVSQEEYGADDDDESSMGDAGYWKGFVKSFSGRRTVAHPEGEYEARSNSPRATGTLAMKLTRMRRRKAGGQASVKNVKPGGDLVCGIVEWVRLRGVNGVLYR